MKLYLSLFLFFLVFSKNLYSQGKARIAVLDFKIIGNVDNIRDISSQVANNIELGLLKESCFSVLERKKNLDVFREVEFQSSFENFLDKDTKIKLLIAGAQYVVLGEIIRNKTLIKLSAKIIQVSSNKIIAGDFTTFGNSCNNIDKLLILYSNNLCDKLILSFKLNLGSICGNDNSEFELISNEVFEPLANAMCNSGGSDILIGILPVLKSTDIGKYKYKGLQRETLSELVNFDDSLDNYKDLLPTQNICENLERLSGIKFISQREMHKYLSEMDSYAESFMPDTFIDKLFVLQKNLHLDFALIPTIQIIPSQVEWGNDSIINTAKFKVHLGLELLSIKNKTFNILFDTNFMYIYEPSYLKIKINEIVIDRLHNRFKIDVEVFGRNMFKQIEWLSIQAVYRDTSVLTTDGKKYNLDSAAEDQIYFFTTFNPDISFYVGEIVSLNILFKLFEKEILNSTYKPKPGKTKYEYVILSDEAIAKREFFDSCKKCSVSFRFLVNFGMIDQKTKSKITLATELSSGYYKVCNTRGKTLEGFEDTSY